MKHGVIYTRELARRNVKSVQKKKRKLSAWWESTSDQSVHEQGIKRKIERKKERKREKG